jgi:hypothetical protein
MVSINIWSGRLLVALLMIAAIFMVLASPCWSAGESPPKPKPAEQSSQPTEQSPKPAEQPNAGEASALPARTPDQVMASLNRAMTWYRQARIVMRSVEGSGVFGHADVQTALRLLARAFDVARAEAALLGRYNPTASSARGRRAEEQ